MNFENKVRNMTINNECSRCGECCGIFIPFTNREIKEIRKYVKKYHIKPVTDRETINGFEARCCFYDKVNKKCNIYPVRPFVCKDFMCNHIDWKERRDKYEKIGSYNSSLKIETNPLATFDDLIYKDYSVILRFVLNLSLDENSKCDSEKLIKNLKRIHREDILEYIVCYLENNEKIEGKDLLNESNN